MGGPVAYRFSFAFLAQIIVAFLFRPRFGAEFFCVLELSKLVMEILLLTCVSVAALPLSPNSSSSPTSRVQASISKLALTGASFFVSLRVTCIRTCTLRAKMVQTARNVHGFLHVSRTGIAQRPNRWAVGKVLGRFSCPTSPLLDRWA